MIALDPNCVRWPTPWRPIADDAAALAFGRWINPAVADTVLGELRREISATHPLSGVACRPVAWEAWGRKDFLFATARPDMPLALVHFTWSVERDPAWPFVIPYRSLRHFFWRERNWVIEARVRGWRAWDALRAGW